MSAHPRLRILRVVTAPECVPWHLGQTLTGLTKIFDVCVVGQQVSQHTDRWPEVSFVDIDIVRQLNLFRDLLALHKLYLLMRSEKPDVVHSIMPKAGLLVAIAARFAGVGVRIHTFTGQVWDTKTGVARRIYRFIDWLIVRLNTVCLTDSHSQSQHLLMNGIGIREKALPVLGSGSLIGVDLRRFDPVRVASNASVTRSSLGIRDEEFVVAYVARKSQDKGALDMLEGFSIARAKSQHMRLLYIGPDESEGAIEALRQTKPHLFTSVIERGAVSNHEEYLLAADVLCMPSHREGFGSVVIDAAALGKPTVGSRIVGLVDSVVDGETGFLFPLGNTDRLAEVLLMLDSDRSLLDRLGKQARTRAVNEFSTEVLTQHLTHFYLDQVSKAC
jgi:glycosyltransferase involved in cell wall biosynthesis